MIRPTLRKILEDRLAIKSTQYRKRHIKHDEFREFFRKKQGKIENADQDFMRELDKIIKEFFDENTRT